MEERQSRLSSMVWRRLRPYFCVRLILLNSMFSNFCHVLKNPITDLCILKTDLGFNGNLPPLESLDNIPVGEKIGMFGFPHCVMGRRVLTYQETEIGAKMLLETSGIKSKYATINIQTRPGQSGSLIFNIRTGAIIGLLIGTYAPASGVIIAGINPHELNQTSYCISANHIKEML